MSNFKIILTDQSLKAKDGLDTNMFASEQIPEPTSCMDHSICELVYLGLNAGMQSRIGQQRDGAGCLMPGDCPNSDAIVRVIKSSYFPANTLCFVQWQPWMLRSNVPNHLLKPIPTEADAIYFASVLGHTGLTAYTSLKLAKLQAHEHIIISSAAGGVGIAATQLALAIGAKVSAIASCFDDLSKLDVNCIKRDFNMSLPSCDVFHDVAGGWLLERAIDAIKVGGRIMLCGYLSQQPPKNLGRLIHKDIRLQGFSVINHLNWQDEFWKLGIALAKEGKLAPICNITNGLENAGAAFCAMFNSRKSGRSLIKI